jgi:hypothetical protein
MMDIQQYLPWITLAVTALVLVVVWLRTKPATVDAAIAATQQASQTARTLVMAAEQLARTGQLPDNDAKFDYTMKQLEEIYPQVSTEQLKATIEAAVYWLRQAGPMVVKR